MSGLPSLFPNQHDAAMKLVPVLRQTRGAYVAHDPGTGKTLTAILIARLLRVEKVAVLTTLSGTGVWERELDKFWPNCDAEVVITNYEKIVSRDRKPHPRLQTLLKWKPDLLICDEGHHAKSPSSKTTRAVWKLADASQHVLYLSGTPTHDALDYWAQYSVICPQEPMFNRSFSEYRADVAVLGGPNRNWVQKFRPAMVERVRQIADSYTHYADSSILNLPEPLETIVPFKLGSEKDIYDEMQKYLVVELQNDEQADAAIVLTKILRLHQIACGHVTTTTGATRDVGDSRLNVLLDLLDQRSSQRIVVACEFVRDIERIREALPRRPVWVVQGGQHPDFRQREIEGFRKHLNSIMLIQNRAGGEAIDLSAASTLIFYSFNRSSITFRQLQGRVWRTGQTGHVQFLYLVADRTIDEEILRGLQEHVDEARLVQRLTKTLVGSIVHVGGLNQRDRA